MEELMQSHAMYIASLIGGVAFAISGFIVGARKNLDWMGLFILSFLTANGGGMLRDALISRMPTALSSNEPFLIVLVVTIIGSIFSVHRHSTFENRWMFVTCDAIGLVAFAITGALVALEIEAPLFGFVTLAFLTSAGGAILRDILVNNIPEVLHSGFYGSVALLVAAAVFVLHIANGINSVNLLIIGVAGLIIRLLAYQFKWRLPKF